MPDRAELILDAMKQGIKDAGFVNVRGMVDRYRDTTQILVKADCPCGLGTSGFQYALAPFADKWEAEYVKRKFNRAALRHIEEDKAEGRWA